MRDRALPSAARVELGFGRIQGVAAALAHKVSLGGVELIVFASSRGFGSLLAQHLERGLVEFFRPLGIALLDARNHHDLRSSTERACADAGRDIDTLRSESLAGGETSRDYEGAGNRSSHIKSGDDESGGSSLLTWLLRLMGIAVDSIRVSQQKWQRKINNQKSRKQSQSQC